MLSTEAFAGSFSGGAYHLDMKMNKLLGMFDKMDMTLELKSGGAASMKTTSPTGKDDEKTGTWKKDGDSVVLTSDNGKEIKCQKSGNKLTCTKDGKDDSLVFVKS